jgi:ubiquinone/menaquinone biosynthesis C-methylase UbiE
VSDETSYEIIAPYYGVIMSHVQYESWGLYLTALWRAHGPDPDTILELGAGTCLFARHSVYPAKAKVVYSDLSPFMLKQAHDVAPSARVAANAVALPFKSQFQLCTMLYDSINYLMSEEEISRCFRETFRVLKSGGLFIFDITTEENSRRYFDKAVYYKEAEGFSFVRECTYEKETRIQSTNFTFFLEEEGGLWRKIGENHRQRIYSVATLQALAAAAGFTVEGTFAGFTFQPGKDRSVRVHFILKKP